MERAVFLSRTAALTACITAARKLGVDDETIALRSAAYPVYRRGEMKGFEAWYPLDATVRAPVCEA
jgi:hypothetical protein